MARTKSNRQRQRQQQHRHEAAGEGDAPFFIPCTPIVLPEDQWEEAGRAAIDVFPANAPLNETNPRRIAVLASKFWGGRAADLTVGFLERPGQAMIDKVLLFANSWGEFARVKFRHTADLSQAVIRVSFQRGGYWSYLGTDCLQIPRSQPTLNLEGFTLRTRDSEWHRVVKHEFGHCLSGDTLIDCPRDLERHPRGIPIKELVGQAPWVYAWKDGKMVVRKASRVWLSKRSVRTVRVRLGTGQGGRRDRAFLPPLELVGTPDHPVLLADGATWRNLGDLRPGDRLCSLYRQKNGERSRIRWTNGPDRVREHAFICEEVFGERPAGHHAHHLNERKLDQRPENLEWKYGPEHVRDHSTGRVDSEQTRAKRGVFWRGRKHSEASRVKMSASQKLRAPASAETRAKIAAVTRGKPQSPEHVAKRAAAVRRFHASKRGAEAAAPFNHTVISVEEADVQDVYDMTVPGADSFVANGVVVHNSLGCPHEQQRRDVLALLDERKVIDYFRATQGWSEQEVREQILVPLEERSLMNPSPADTSSIMCYSFPGSVTKSGQPIPGGVDYSAADKLYFGKTYPKEEQPPGPDGAGPIVTLVGLDAGGREVARYRIANQPP